MLPMVCYSRRPQSGQITCYFKRTYHVLPTPTPRFPCLPSPACLYSCTCPPPPELKSAPAASYRISSLIGDHHGYKDRVPRTRNQSLGGASRPLRPGG